MADLSPSLCFYGDDFTGSTDALDALTSANVSAALLLEPTDEAMRLLPDVQAVGLAGMSRAMSPDDMEAHLADAFRFLADLNPRVLHYKVCSTFDSSPTKGSIGKAMEIGPDRRDLSFHPNLKFVTWSGMLSTNFRFKRLNNKTMFLL